MMDIKSHIYAIRTHIGKAKAFRLGGTNYLLTTEKILDDIHYIEVYDSNSERCNASVIAIDIASCLGLLYIHDSEKSSWINYLPDLVEDSYDVSTVTSSGRNQSSNGYISNFVTNDLGQTIYYHSMTISSELLGSPLLDQNGLCIGILNTIIEEDEVINYASPIKNYLDLIAKYESLKVLDLAKLPILHRCSLDDDLKLYDTLRDIGFCDPKGENQMETTKLGDVAFQISKMISQLNFDINQSRVNINEWEVMKGSARISIVYHPSKGLLLADAIVANHSDTSQSMIYEYLLRQNYILEGLNFSVVDQDIILSMKLYDNYLEFETMSNLFKKLLLKADELDDVLHLKLKK